MNRACKTCRRIVVLLMLLAPAIAHAQRVVRGPGFVSMPHGFSDASGNQWMIYPGGWCQMQGNQPIYSQGAMLMVNGQQPGMRNNNGARMDEKTGEIIFENMTAGGVSVTRRILLDKEGSYLRYIDILRNQQPGEQNLNVQIQSNLNFGIDQGQNISDPRKKDNVIGFTSSNQNGRAVVEMYAGKGSKIPAGVTFQQGNTVVSANMQITVPAGKEVAIMHLHGIVATPEQGTQFVQNLREGKLLASLSSDIRKAIINFSGGQGFIGDRELLRGELFDVVEIRGGDQMRGNLKEQSFKLNTFYGNVELPASRVVGLINVGEFRPRQLLITTDGEIFGGKLTKETIELELTSGQVTQIPLSQIMRVGYRKRADEPEEWTFDKPFVSLRTGERVGVEMPTQPIEIVTRYGTLSLNPTSISTIVFQSDEHGVHDVYLTDGSKFSGLVRASEFEMTLTGGGSTTQPSDAPKQSVKFPASAITRIQFAGAPQDVDESESPTLDLMNDDKLVGHLNGDLKLDTAFDTLTIHTSEIRKLTRGKDSPLDVQVTLWDSSIVSGQLQDPTLKCQLQSDVAISIPVALIEEYSQPRPRPSESMVQKIKTTVAQLNADDWKARDRAEAELTAMGPVVIAVLKEIRTNQPPEAQQRIDQVLASVNKKK